MRRFGDGTVRRLGASPKRYAVACSTGTGRNNSGLKNRLAIAVLLPLPPTMLCALASCAHA